MRGRAALQLGLQPGQLRLAQPALRTARAVRGQGGIAASPPPPSPLVGRLRADPQLAGHLHRADPLLEHRRGLQPHRLTPGTLRRGQATTVGVSHDVPG
jgi:hypothetical protein